MSVRGLLVVALVLCLLVLAAGCAPRSVRPAPPVEPVSDPETAASSERAPPSPTEAPPARKGIGGGSTTSRKLDAASAAVEPATAEAVLARLARRMRAADCSDPQVRRAAALQLRNRSALGEKLERVLPLLDYVLAGIEARDLPGQFALIPWAESGFRADPGNRGTVQGLWQFTISTGRGQGLRIDQRYDGRRAAIESTDAALDHLADLLDRFEDWRLAILAYNVGPGGLARALSRRAPGSPGLPAGLRAHSYAYLHKITALSCMLVAPERHAITLPDGEFERLVPAPRPRDVHSVHHLASRAGIEADLLLQYNAAFRGGDIADDAPALILLPASAAARLSLAATASAPSPHAPETGTPVAVDHDPGPQPRRSIVDHVVRTGETLWRIARRHRVALADLLRWNGLERSSIIRPGQRLRLVPPP